ncbi:hypothetical protein BABINDRAFT_161410 [Babjeviella inositovora NRRL Y-12698]|uniref:TauD/TfdA-like domain-containing protein n=1 Tax=Babjeviella inositovora NRRL Y-12698 TaxID=984486 RepID=A0A1E3QQD8_9ASCO|nr:uncharacterized protein BABINDRAFT_161410 [Babjeviella inositovora NRRL Y-12698]ODQ79694.1 hypothetical protein BABINDRAFT_161410 [Babjeviella inositovora NRRL Y-12698]
MSTSVGKTISAISGTGFPSKAPKDAQVVTVNETEKRKSSYPEYLPIWDRSITAQPAYTKIPYHDKALDADPAMPNLLPKQKLDNKEILLSNLTPKFGTEVKGLQLADLVDNPRAKDELALLVAQRGVLLFRDQEDLLKLGPAKIKEFVSYFGALHQHPTSGGLAGHPEFHNTYRSGDFSPAEFFKTHTTSTAWHSDVTYELQPPSYSLLAMVDTPPSGGDTIFADAREAYNRLSPGFQALLTDLRASHSAHAQADTAVANGGILRREPITTFHPIVRNHPVTKKKSLFVNSQFTRTVEGLKTEESNALLKFLLQHLNNSVDYQLRVQWKQFSIVLWDNRSMIHSALVDFDTDSYIRHAFRLLVRAEIPTGKIEEEADDA